MAAKNVIHVVRTKGDPRMFMVVDRHERTGAETDMWLDPKHGEDGATQFPSRNAAVLKAKAFGLTSAHYEIVPATLKPAQEQGGKW